MPGKNCIYRNDLGTKGLYISSDLNSLIMIYCITTAAKFRFTLRFNQHDIAMTKEEPLLRKNNESILKRRNSAKLLCFRKRN